MELKLLELSHMHIYGDLNLLNVAGLNFVHMKTTSIPGGTKFISHQMLKSAFAEAS